MEPFLGHTFNLATAWTVDITFPLILKQAQNIDGIVIQEKDKQLLRSLRKERLIYLSNHPSQSEPPVAYYVANLMGARFKFMAARQVFDWGYGFVGRLIQNLGAFSVLAGAADRESIKTVRSILAEPEGKLVLYPEGEPTSGENDSLLPFQNGIAQLAFWGFEDARKENPNAEIYVLPAFVKYVMTGSDAAIKSDLHVHLKIIEKKLDINPGNKNLLRRFLTVGRILLEAAEKEYSVPMASQADYDYRVGRVRHRILDIVAEKLSLKGYDHKADAITKLRHLLSVIELITVGYPDPRLPSVDKTTLDWAKQECEKAYDLIVIKPDYLLSRPTAERFYEWLQRYETYIFGQTKNRPRKAHVSFGQPVKISEYYSAYKDNKRHAVDAFVKKLRGDLLQLLDKAQDLTQPIVHANDVDENEVA